MLDSSCRLSRFINFVYTYGIMADWSSLIGGLGIGSRVMNNRIFIADVLKKSGIAQKWQDMMAYVCSSDSPRDANQQGGLPTLNGYISKVNAFQDELIRVARED